jgi:signal transduction histidine kinase/ActR/RegA family two-component response regulator
MMKESPITDVSPSGSTASVTGTGVIHLNASGVVVWINRVAERWCACPEGTAQGHPLNLLMPRLAVAENNAPSADWMRFLQSLDEEARPLVAVCLPQLCGLVRLRAQVEPLQPTLGCLQLTLRPATADMDVEHTSQSIELAHRIAHDFNNLLTGILGNMTLARQCQQDAEHLDQALRNAIQATHRAQDLCQQLMSLAKQRRILRQPIALPRLLRECGGFASNGSSCRIRYFFPPQSPYVMGDESQLSQVFNNLLLNAIQAMPQGGVIDVLLKLRHLPTNNPEALSVGDYLQVCIQDEGPGIASELLPRIFEPYVTSKPEGTGLGLSSCFAILKQHDGHITASNRQGPQRGAIFAILLPVVSKPVMPPAHVAEPAAEPRVPDVLVHGHGRVLVVDDEALIKQITCDMLTHLGYEAEGVTTSTEACQRVQASMAEGRPFDAFVLDLTLPGDDSGVRLLSRLRSLGANGVAIISSGYQRHPMLREHFENGFAGSLNKPFDIQQLGTCLQAALGKTPQTNKTQLRGHHRA